MPKYKLKTHKATAKRFRVTGSGKLLRMKGHSSHLRRKKPASVRRLYSKMIHVSRADVRRVKRLIPYAG